MPTAAKAAARKEPPHPTARPRPVAAPPAAAAEPRHAPAPVAKPRAAGDAVPTFDPPEWETVTPNRPGVKPKDFPVATLRKGGTEASLNVKAAQMLTGVGTNQPPGTFHVSLHVDRRQRLVGMRVVLPGGEKLTGELFLVRKEGPGRTGKRSEGTWRVGIKPALQAADLDIAKGVQVRMLAFGNHTFGFQIPEQP